MSSSIIFCRLLFICCVTYSVIWPSSASQCGVNEIPVECKDFCQKCEYKDGGCFHPAVCTPGCDCIPGFLRDEQNQCIPAGLCPGGTGNPCLQEKDPGPCNGNFKRFYFNKRTGQCEQFIYGGCFGNSNNFFYKQDCEARCKENPCLQEKDHGPCNGTFRRFYFNKWTGQCQEFIYGGCFGNSNNFFYKQDCEATCKDQCESDEQYYPDIPDCKNTCENYNNPDVICPKYFAPRPGCFCKKGLVKRKDGKCVKPENCFPPGNPCLQEKDSGPCNGKFKRFYFNKRTGQCEEFIYGGCFGNSNNFFYKQDCEARCKGNRCLQEKDPGPCYGSFKRFYFNKWIGQCQEFIYGGCFGNSNNFFTKQDCDATCKGIGPNPPQQCPAGEFPVKCIDRCQRCEYKNGGCVQVGVCTPGCNCLSGFLRDKTNKCIPAAFCP